MKTFEKASLCTLSFIVVVFATVTLVHFGVFLSSHTYLKHPARRKQSYSTNDGAILAPFIKNMALIMMFMLQHSLQAKMNVKRFLYFRGYEVIERSIYITGTCIALQILMFYWQPIPSVTFWEIPTQKYAVLWFCFAFVHSMCWLIMYCALLLLDISEFFGVKQVYYYISGWLLPGHYKSVSLRQLYSHCRHVNFSTLALVLFIHPVMQLDRLLIGYSFIVYMLFGFRVDDYDVAYIKRRLEMKFESIYGASLFPPPQ